MIILSNANLESLKGKELQKNNCRADVLRLDKIHPVVAGNKWFKLKYYLEDALIKNSKIILTFGGAYSNHIVATACAAKTHGLQAVGIIRGEKPATLSPTLQSAACYGMQLIFVSRERFKRKQEDPHIQQIICSLENGSTLREETDNSSGLMNLTHGQISEELQRRHSLTGLTNVYIIPEGGAGEKGIKGAGEILDLVAGNSYTHIICAIGTGTMFTGILNASAEGQQVIGIPVLKGMQNLAQEYAPFIKKEKKAAASFYHDYHFGGYAKKTIQLLDFINEFYKNTGIPADFVYTGKLFYAFSDMLKNGRIKPDSRVLLIHSGGLQGNDSLPPGTLAF